MVPNVKALLPPEVVAVELGAGAAVAAAAAPNWKPLPPAEGAGVTAEGAVVGGAALQFPNSDFAANGGWAAGSAAGGPAVLLESPPNTRGAGEGAAMVVLERGISFSF